MQGAHLELQVDFKNLLITLQDYGYLIWLQICTGMPRWKFIVRNKPDNLDTNCCNLPHKIFPFISLFKTIF